MEFFNINILLPFQGMQEIRHTVPEVNIRHMERPTYDS